MHPGPEPRRPPGREPVRFERVAKAEGGFRLLSWLDPVDLRRMQRILARLGPRLEASLGPEVRANRLAAGGRTLQPWGRARASWRAEVALKLRYGYRSILVTDVRDCYASIGDPALAGAIHGLGSPDDLAGELMNLLALLRDEGLRGLPVGPEPSAALANLVLAAGDTSIREAGAQHVRWVDDFVVFTRGRRHSIRALDALRRSLHEVGLELNEAKTAMLDPDEARVRLLAGRAPRSGPPSGSRRGMMPAP